MEEMDIEETIKEIAIEILTWPKWKRDLVGIEGDYTITQIDLRKIIEGKK